MSLACFICRGVDFDHVTPEYRRCCTCGHETLAESQQQAYMLNDALRGGDSARPTALDRFQSAVLERFRQGRSCRQLVDIGSGSGQFLLHNGRKFERSCGIEITPEAVAYSRNNLGLHVVSDIADIAGEIDVVTAWHSLEHFPAPALVALLEQLRLKLSAGGCIIVSVPNAASFQYRWFRGRYAFFDVPAHLHQFTAASLLRLFASHGFHPSGAVTSWPYNLFGYVQGLLNLVIPDHNHLYYRLKRGRAAPSILPTVASFCLLPFALPIGAACALVDAARPSRQAVLTYCFEKRA